MARLFGRRLQERPPAPRTQVGGLLMRDGADFLGESQEEGESGGQVGHQRGRASMLMAAVAVIDLVADLLGLALAPSDDFLVLRGQPSEIGGHRLRIEAGTPISLTTREAP